MQCRKQNKKVIIPSSRYYIRHYDEHDGSCPIWGCVLGGYTPKTTSVDLARCTYLLLISGAPGIRHPGSCPLGYVFFRYLSREKRGGSVARAESPVHQILQLGLYIEVCQGRLAPSLVVCGPPHVSIAPCIDHLHPCHRSGHRSVRSIAKNTLKWCQRAFCGSEARVSSRSC